MKDFRRICEKKNNNEEKEILAISGSTCNHKERNAKQSKYPGGSPGYLN